jgi:hypothetical protein
MTSRPIQTRSRFGSVPLALNLAMYHNSPDRSTKSTPSGFNALRLLVSTGFQVLFHSPSGVLFTFPSRYCFTIGHQVVFRLGGWSPRLPARFLVSRYSGYRPVTRPFAYGTFTLCGLGFPAAHSARLRESLCLSATPQHRSVPVWPLPHSLATTNGISFDFYSCGYLDVSVPRVYLQAAMDSLQDTWAFTPCGFPHSDIYGSKAICASP